MNPGSSVHLTSHAPSVTPRRPRLISLASAASVALLLFAAEPVLGGELEWKRLHDQAELHFQRGNLEQAELFVREALREAEALGENHRALEVSLARAVLVLRLRGKPQEALALARRGVKLATRRYGPEHANTAMALQGEAEVLFAQKNYPEAEKLHRRALAIFEKGHGGQSYQAATGLHNVGTMLLAQEKYPEAEKFLRRALAVKERVLGSEHRSIAHTLNNLALVLEAQGKRGEAAQYRRRIEAYKDR